MLLEAIRSPGNIYCHGGTQIASLAQSCIECKIQSFGSVYSQCILQLMWSLLQKSAFPPVFFIDTLIFGFEKALSWGERGPEQIF